MKLLIRLAIAYSKLKRKTTRNPQDWLRLTKRIDALEKAL